MTTGTPKAGNPSTKTAQRRARQEKAREAREAERRAARRKQRFVTAVCALGPRVPDGRLVRGASWIFEGRVKISPLRRTWYKI